MAELKPIVDAPIKPSQFRHTRMAVSVFFGLLTLALCLLWVVSFWEILQLTMQLRASPTGNNFLWQHTGQGVISIHLLNVRPITHSWYLGFESIAGRQKTDNPLLCFKYVHQWNGEYMVAFPIWVPLLTLVILWLSCRHLVQSSRFSLRTMFIATTLVAVVLGLGVWLAG